MQRRNDVNTMRHITPLFLVFVITLPARGSEFSARVVGISDGDTITVLTADKTQQRIRLFGIDAPETGQDFGGRAKQAASGLAFGKQVTVRVRDKDRYGRTVAEVILPDGRSLNHELVKDGLAWWYRSYAPTDTELARLESEARTAKRGLWSQPESGTALVVAQGPRVALDIGSDRQPPQSLCTTSRPAAARRPPASRRIAWSSNRPSKPRRPDTGGPGIAAGERSTPIGEGFRPPVPVLVRGQRMKKTGRHKDTRSSVLSHLLNRLSSPPGGGLELVFGALGFLGLELSEDDLSFPVATPDDQFVPCHCFRPHEIVKGQGSADYFGETLIRFLAELLQLPPRPRR